MDFRTITRKVVTAFTDEGVAYALIGGFAVGAWGSYRNTSDIDFLVRLDDMPKVQSILLPLGYNIRFQSENVTQFVSISGAYGEVDFLHAFRDASLRMLERAVEKTIFNGGLSLRVLVPEDLIGLKLQAFSNDVSRQPLDMWDIESLMRLHGKEMDWELVRQYFEIFEAVPLFERLKEKYRGT